MSADALTPTTPMARRSGFARRLVGLALPDFLLEAIARLVGHCAEFVFPDRGLAAECLARARLWNLKHGFQARDIGRSVVLGGAGRLVLDPGVSLHHGVVVMVGPHGHCRIGARSHISHGSVLAAGGGLVIGEDCAFSSGIAIYTASNWPRPGVPLSVAPLRVAPVTIGDGVLIGANAVVLPGVTVGDGAVVGAGAVVTEDVPPNTIVVGAPARPLHGNSGR